jgi:drug/metabolite transporter (DMT)-like permease
MLGEIMLVLLLTAQGVAGDVLLKRAVSTVGDTRVFLIALAALVYGLAAPGWYFIMRTVDLGVVGTWISSLTIIALALVGWLVFGETLSPRLALGVAFAFAAVALFAFASRNGALCPSSSPTSSFPEGVSERREWRGAAWSARHGLEF